MTLSPLAGRPAPPEILVDLARLEREYYARVPDLADPTQLVSFGLIWLSLVIYSADSMLRRGRTVSA